MLDRLETATRPSAQNIARARAFYADKLGLTPSEERPGGLLYRCGGSKFAVFASAAEVRGDYPSAGTGERAAWFRDSEGNLIGIGQPVRD